MRTVVRWSLAVLACAVVLVIAALLAKDAMLRGVVERRIHEETGLSVRLESFHLGLGSVSLRNLQVLNPPEFGGAPLIDIAELSLQAHPSQLADHKLHLKTLRLHLRELNIVRNPNGQVNVEDLARSLQPEAIAPRNPVSPQAPAPPTPAPKPASPPVPQPPAPTTAPPPVSPPIHQSPKPSSEFEFAGIDRLQLTFERVNYLDRQHPGSSRQFEVGLDNEVATNLATQAAVETWAKAVLIRVIARELYEHPPKAKKAGLNVLLDSLSEDQAEGPSSH